jgi:hypothetical protein
MPLPLYMDVHVPQAITAQLRLRGIDVLAAAEDGAERLSDEELLAHATTLGRVVFTQDVRFRALAEEWQRVGRTFAGLVFGAQLGGTIGEFVRDLQLIAEASDPTEWANVIEFIPFRPR